MTPGAEPAEQVRCPHCDAPVDVSRPRRYPSADRVGCMACGVQLVRRPGESWESIRG